jgi:membrane protease YdiL (CAAX protease family)
VSTHLTATLLGVLIGYLTAFRVLMVWVYDRTGSLFVAMLMHASFTASLLVMNPLGTPGTHLVTYSFTLHDGRNRPAQLWQCRELKAFAKPSR